MLAVLCKNRIAYPIRLDQQYDQALGIRRCSAESALLATYDVSMHFDMRDQVRLPPRGNAMQLALLGICKKPHRPRSRFVKGSDASARRAANVTGQLVLRRGTAGRPIHGALANHASDGHCFSTPPSKRARRVCRPYARPCEHQCP